MNMRDSINGVAPLILGELLSYSLSISSKFKIYHGIFS